MAGMLARVAQVRAEIGKREEAVEILASVLADAVSSQSLMVDNVPVSEKVSELLAELERVLDAETYAAARLQGGAKSLDVAAKELLAT